MTIASAINRNDYVGNNTTPTYNYGFKIFNKNDLLVTQKDTDNVETTLTVDTDYTVANVGDVNGGTITLTAGNLSTNYTLTIRRVRDLKQETDIRNQGDFYPESHEDTFDHLVMLAQQQQDEIDRSIKNPESISSSAFSPTLPTTITSGGGRALKINDAGNGFELGPTATQVAQYQDAINSSPPWFNVLDYGDGTRTDETLSAAITALGSSTKYTLLIKSGTWTINANVTVPSNVMLWIEHGAILAVSAGIFTLNGGFINLPLSQIFSISGSGAVSIANPQQTMYPQNFGAVGDGSTDDTEALNDTFSSCKAINMPPQNYVYKSGKLKIRSNNTIYAYGAKIQIDDGAFARGVLIDHENDVNIFGLKIELIDTTSTSIFYGLAIQNSSRITCVDVVVEDINWSTSKVASTNPVFYYGFLISQSTTSSLDSGTYAGDGSDDLACNDVKFIRCKAKGCYQYGFEIFPKVASYNHLLDGCIAEDIGNINSASIDPAGFKTGQCVTGHKMVNCKMQNCWHGFIAANWSVGVWENNEVINFHESAFLLGANDHSYFDASTGGNAGTGHHIGSNAYTRGYCRISKNNGFLDSSFTPLGTSSCVGYGWFNPSFTDNGPIIIEDNDISSYTSSVWTGAAIVLAAAVPNFVSRRNTIRGRGGLSVTGASNFNSPIYDGDTYINNVTTETFRYARLGGTNARILNCKFINQTTYGLWLNGAGSIVDKCQFIDLDPSNHTTTYAITTDDTGSNKYYSIGNTVIGGDVDAYLFVSSSNPTFHTIGDVFDSNIPYKQSSSVTTGEDEVCLVMGGTRGSRIFMGSAAPSSGAYVQGDIVLDTTPSASSFIGWVCTSGGSPGTWKTFGAIST